MLLSMTTDYVQGTGSPYPYLQRIANAGFTHVHWCHQWNTDFVYSPHEVDEIARWLDHLHLRLLDLHGSAGVEKDWVSPVEYQRLAGVDLVANRIEMTARLGGGVVIMHLPAEPENPSASDGFWDRVRRSLDALEPICRRSGVRIAIENGSSAQFATLVKALAMYDPGYLGLCYDSGHGNQAGDGLDCLARVKERLISVHLHDNDGTADQHKPMFTGTVDWPRLASILAQSSYDGPISQELLMRLSGYDDEEAFLAQAHEDGVRFAHMVRANRQESTGPVG